MSNTAERLREYANWSGPVSSNTNACMIAAADELDALREEIDLLRARAPRAYILTRASEWRRMFREAIGFLHTCRRQHHGTDIAGRRHLIDALEAAMKELGEPENERRARAIAELNADEIGATSRPSHEHGGS